MTGDKLPKEFESPQVAGETCPRCGWFIVEGVPHACYAMRMGAPDYTEALVGIAAALERLCDIALEGWFR